MTRNPRRAVPDDLSTHTRAQPVCADQDLTLHGLARGKRRTHRATVLSIAGHLCIYAKGNPRVFLTALQQHPVKVAAMDHSVGISEAFAKGLVQRDVDDFLSADSIHQAQHIDIDRLLACPLANADGVERMKCVGAELDTRADLAELRRALHDGHVKTLSREPQRSRQPADPAAGDEYGISGHPPPLMFSVTIIVMNIRDTSSHGGRPQRTKMARNWSG